VRDLLLERAVVDIDLAIEGDAVALAERLADAAGARLTVHRQFGTATLEFPDLSVDLATARAESYSRPGALPVVRPGRLAEDLARRDFSVNAMAISLNREEYGRLIDPCGGLADLKSGLIRVLHAGSFVDDPTRLWRAVRYASRLDFKIEKGTLALLRRDLEQITNVSGERVFYELECVFAEPEPERVLALAQKTGLLAALNPSLPGDGRLKEAFASARALSAPARPPLALYLALWTYGLDSTSLAALGSFLRLPKALAGVLADTQRIKSILGEMAAPAFKPSGVYRLLHGLAPAAITSNIVASENTVVRERLRLYLDKLRYVRTTLSGDDLIRLGLTPGPRVKALLAGLLDGRLDGRLKSRADEERWLRVRRAISPSSI
jgi:tRNA nucleotidyltransferase (CCA-adding enzyme)